MELCQKAIAIIRKRSEIRNLLKTIRYQFKHQIESKRRFLFPIQLFRLLQASSIGIYNNYNTISTSFHKQDLLFYHSPPSNFLLYIIPSSSSSFITTNLSTQFNTHTNNILHKIKHKHLPNSSFILPLIFPPLNCQIQISLPFQLFFLTPTPQSLKK